MNALDKFILFYDFLVIIKFILLLASNITILVISSLNTVNNNEELQKFYIGGILSAALSIIYQIKRLIFKDESILSELPRLFVISWGIYGLVNISQLRSALVTIVLLMISGFLNLFKMQFPVGENNEIRT